MIRFDAKLRRGQFALDAQFNAGSGLTALFGPSGSGKTTVINLIAGLLRPDEGRIISNNRVLTDTLQKVFVPPHQRRAGLVFQDAQLFPHMTVDQNLRFGGWFASKDRARPDFANVVDILGIEGILGRRPAGLSGGERQRVALARALLAGPEILLMDEPLAGLDRDRKQEILPLIERMRGEFKTPIIYVTHAADEVERLADQIVKFEAGYARAAD